MNPLEKYKSATASTASTQNQLIFIFDEILKLLLSAQKAMGEGNHETKFKALSRIVEVLYILKIGINPEAMDENNKAIDAFYGATISQLENINISGKEPEELQPIIDAITEIRAALVKDVAS